MASLALRTPPVPTRVWHSLQSLLSRRRKLCLVPGVSSSLVCFFFFNLSSHCSILKSVVLQIRDLPTGDHCSCHKPPWYNQHILRYNHLPGTTSTGEWNFSSYYFPQVLQRPIAHAQNAGCTACWGDRTWKRLATATYGGCSCGCNYLTPWQKVTASYLADGGSRHWIQSVGPSLESADVNLFLFNQECTGVGPQNTTRLQNTPRNFLGLHPIHLSSIDTGMPTGYALHPADGGVVT